MVLLRGREWFRTSDNDDNMIAGRLSLCIAIMVAVSLSVAHAGNLPDRRVTPGVVNPQLTKAVVCSPKFRTGKWRHVTPKMHRQVFAAYGMRQSKRPCPCEDDHLISIELGGSNDNKNRWPQPYAGQWGARKKDALETHLHYLVCRGALPLSTAQREIRTNWVASYQRRYARIRRALREGVYSLKGPE